MSFISLLFKSDSFVNWEMGYPKNPKNKKWLIKGVVNGVWGLDGWPFPMHFLFNSYSFPIQFLFMSYSFLIHVLFIYYSGPIHFLFVSYSSLIYFLIISYPFSSFHFQSFFKKVIRTWNKMTWSERKGKESKSSQWYNPESPIQNPIQNPVHSPQYIFQYIISRT